MKLNFYSRTIKLNTVHVETLKVALLDAQKQIDYERSLLNDDSEQLTSTVAKNVRLQDLIQQLGLDNVCM